jgi:chromosomal replication initiation ATPase DnaA
VTIPEIFAKEWERTGGDILTCIRVAIEADVLAKRARPKRVASDRAKRIISAVAIRYGLTSSDLVGPLRLNDLVVARRDAMLMLRELTGMSYPRIGRCFGDRDHTTVMEGCRRAKQRALEHPEKWQSLTKICEDALGTVGETPRTAS